MRLDRYDLMGTAATAATGAVFWAHVAAVSPLAGVRPTAVAVLATGVAGCATNGSRPGTPVSGRYANVMGAFGALVMVLGIGALVSGTEALLVGAVSITGLLWLVTTTRHLVARQVTPVPARDEPRSLAGVR